MALVALWAIVMNAWLIEGNAATTAMIGWAVLLVLFIATTRSTNPWPHAGAAAFVWVVLISEIVLELDRGVSSL